jgi:branched-chain amino acid transport system substrate-binding protein
MVKLVGSGSWEFANAGNTDLFVGGWYPGPDPQGWRAFSGQFIKSFGQPPPRVASIAYDAVGIAIAIASEPQGARFTAAGLTRPSGFAGVDGTIRLTAAGLAERQLAILEVQKMGSVVIEAAQGRADNSRVTAVEPGPFVPLPARDAGTPARMN